MKVKKRIIPSSIHPSITAAPLSQPERLAKAPTLASAQSWQDANYRLFSKHQTQGQRGEQAEKRNAFIGHPGSQDGC